MAEAHCGRGEADRRTARSHVTLALPLRGLACLLAGGSHSPLAAMASADGRKHIAMSLEAVFNAGPGAETKDLKAVI